MKTIDKYSPSRQRPARYIAGFNQGEEVGVKIFGKRTVLMKFIEEDVDGDYVFRNIGSTSVDEWTIPQDAEVNLRSRVAFKNIKRRRIFDIFEGRWRVVLS